MESLLQSYIASFNVWLALGLFVAYVILDGLIVLYTIAVTEHKPARAAYASALRHLIIAFAVVSYVTNILYVLPVFLGSWVGTYIAVRHPHFARHMHVSLLK